MKWSKSFIADTLKEDPAEAEIPSHKLLLKAGFIRKLSSGIYTILPPGMKVIKKIEKIVREEVEKAGSQEVLLPILSPAELWKQTGRWEEYGRDLMRVKDRHDKEFALSPTHEEIITKLVANELKSYRQLPLNLYQIQVKFRDEVRPRFGSLRGREFLMKDGYSFDRNEETADLTYKKMFDAYCRIFERCKLDFKIVEAESGLIGGLGSHEFMVLAENGEDEIVICEHCGYSANIERVKNKDVCYKCGKASVVRKVIEVAHVFKLGTKYSKVFKAVFLDETGKEQYTVMGCFGIGISRLMAAAVEQSHDENGIIWQLPIAPYQILILPVNMDDKNVLEASEAIYNELLKYNIDVLFDDRNESAGVKFKDADLIGVPLRVTVGSKSLKEGKIELKLRSEKEPIKYNLNQIIDKIKEML